MSDEAQITEPDYPPGEYAIVEFMGHVTLVGRIAEVERFGTKMLAIEPLFNGLMLGVVFHGGASIYRLTPCSVQVALERQPTDTWQQLPPPIVANIPPALLPAVEPAPFEERHEEYRDEEEILF